MISTKVVDFLLCIFMLGVLFEGVSVNVWIVFMIVG